MKATKANFKKGVAARIISLALAATLLLGAAAALAGCGGGNAEPFDYLEEDLTKYVAVDSSRYRDADIKIDLPDVSDLDVEVYILSQLKAKKGGTIYDGEYRYDKVIYPGDKVYIYYRGYELLENGEERDLSGTCNFSSDELTELEIGSGSFVPGFELGLVGKNPQDYSRFEKITEGEVLDTDVVYLTCTYSYETGETNQNYLLRIDLSDPDLEKKFGTGIADYVKSLKFGETKREAKTFTLAGTDDKFTLISARLDFLTRCEENPIVVKTVFPYDYREEAFRNKTVYFDVYVKRALHYEGVMLSDEAVTGQLGIKEAELEKYEGGSAVEKYRNMVKSQLVESNAENRKYLAENTLWDKLISGATVKRMPSGEVNRLYNEYYYSLRDQYLSYGLDQYYPDFSDFLVANFELEAGEDPGEYMRSMVESEVKEKLIFYSIVKTEGFVPDGEKFAELYNSIIKESFDAENESSGKTYATEEAYNTAFEKYKTEAVEKNGEEYFAEIVYYRYGMDKILDLVNIITP